MVNRVQKFSGYPSEDGFYMPGEFEPHWGCIMIWPERPGSWIYGAAAAREAFRQVIAAIAESEHVYVAAGRAGISSACEMLFGDGAARQEEGQIFVCEKGKEQFAWQKRVEIFLMETDDAWARDVAPTFVVRRRAAGVLNTEMQDIMQPDMEQGTAQDAGQDKGQNAGQNMDIRAVCWEFNAWGGPVDGLYASWEKDNAFAAAFAEKYGYDFYDAAPFVLEGGSVHSDGDGTVMVTESCLLSAGRNPSLSKQEIEEQLKRYLGAGKVLWLPRGIYQDETNEHVDNVCAFLRPGEVVLAWTDNREDPQYALSEACLSYLEQETDARGRKLVIHRLPVPDHPVCLTQEEVDGYEFEEGEDEREAGERLAASYVNFYFSNEAVVMPVFGGENQESDMRAISLMKKWNPERKVIPVYARDILVGGGNIHCITQQIPAGRQNCNRKTDRKETEL
ncbi:MAG: agmatine deiminase family protein [Lachnospiraceae bacterium]|nr:agmatine deiminase family protein [Lachnospiraceae bacterium]